MLRLHVISSMARVCRLGGLERRQCRGGKSGGRELLLLRGEGWNWWVGFSLWLLQLLLWTRLLRSRKLELKKWKQGLICRARWYQKRAEPWSKAVVTESVERMQVWEGLSDISGGCSRGVAQVSGLLVAPWESVSNEGRISLNYCGVVKVWSLIKGLMVFKIVE